MRQKRILGSSGYPVDEIPQTQSATGTDTGGQGNVKLSKPVRKRGPNKSKSLDSLVDEFRMKKERLIARYTAKINRVMFK